MTTKNKVGSAKASVVKSVSVPLFSFFLGEDSERREIFSSHSSIICLEELFITLSNIINPRP